MYNLADRQNDELIDMLAEEGVACVPFLPLGGFSQLESSTLSTVAARLEATSMSVALAWLLQRSSSIRLIPGTSSVTHWRENVTGAGRNLSGEELAERVTA
jgi:pyridoxine 4-dehydrogenase